MKREVKNLQDAVNSIQIKEGMQKEIILNVKNATMKKKYSFSNVAAAVVLIAIFSGVLSVPVRAFVNSFIQERMEAVPEEEMTAMVDDLYRQDVGGDSFSRAYTEEENRKMSELAQKYKEGTFPAGELARAESVEEAEKLGFCFLVSNSTFYLPDRELTEEELLQIIDFYAKRDYAVINQHEQEYTDEIEERKENEEQKKTEVIESGGITEEDALEIAKEWLIKIYGITGEGLENNHYFVEDTQAAGKTEVYNVNWTDFASRQYYYFYINATDGSLVWTAMNNGTMEEKTFAVTEAAVLLPQLEQSAISLVEEQLQQDYKDSYYAYYSVDGVLSNVVSFIFVREDNSGFALTYYWNGTFHSFKESPFSSYQEKYDNMKESAETAESHNHKGEEVEINLVFEEIQNGE